MAQKGTRRRGSPPHPGLGRWHSTEVPGGGVSEASTAVPNLGFGTGRDLLSSGIPFEHFKVEEHCCLWGHSSGAPQGRGGLCWLLRTLTDICFCWEIL